MRRTSRSIELILWCVLLALGRTAVAAEMPRQPEKLPPARAVDAWLAVVEDVRESSVRRNYAEGRIALLGKAAQPRLLELWQGASDERRGTLAEILGMMTDLSEQGVETLMAELRAKGASAHPNVPRALADRDVKKAVPLMLEALPTASGETRLALLHALGRLADPQAADTLVRALDEPDRLVSTTATDGLARLLASMRLATGDAKARDAYRSLFRRALDYADKGPNLGARRVLIGGLGLVGDADAVPLLRRLLRRETVELRIAAAGSLGRLQSREAVDDLAEAARSTDPVLRRTALDALAAIGPDAVGCVPTLVEILEESSPKERRDVLRALQQIAQQPFGDNPDQWRQWWEERKAREEPPA